MAITAFGALESILLLIAFHQAQSEVSCTAGVFALGDSAQINCDFGFDVNATQHNFNVIFYRNVESGTDPGTYVLLCNWIPHTVSMECTSRDGYVFNKKASRTLALHIPKVSYDMMGMYICQLVPDDGVNVSPCDLVIEGQHQGMMWSEPFQSEGISQLLGCRHPVTAFNSLPLSKLTLNELLPNGTRAVVWFLKQENKCSGSNMFTSCEMDWEKNQVTLRTVLTDLIAGETRQFQCVATFVGEFVKDLAYNYTLRYVGTTATTQASTMQASMTQISATAPTDGNGVLKEVALTLLGIFFVSTTVLATLVYILRKKYFLKRRDGQVRYGSVNQDGWADFVCCSLCSKVTVNTDEEGEPMIPYPCGTAHKCIGTDDEYLPEKPDLQGYDHVKVENKQSDEEGKSTPKTAGSIPSTQTTKFEEAQYKNFNPNAAQNENPPSDSTVGNSSKDAPSPSFQTPGLQFSPQALAQVKELPVDASTAAQLKKMQGESGSATESNKHRNKKLAGTTFAEEVRDAAAPYGHIPKDVTTMVSCGIID